MGEKEREIDLVCLGEKERNSNSVCGGERARIRNSVCEGERDVEYNEQWPHFLSSDQITSQELRQEKSSNYIVIRSFTSNSS